jgi:hypothetical protein
MIVTSVGMGCGGRRFCRRVFCTRTNGEAADGEVVWS